MLLVLDGHTLDVDRRELRRGGNPVAATPQVFDLLLYLIRNRDRVVGKDELIGSVWGGRIVSDSALRRASTPCARCSGIPAPSDALSAPSTARACGSWATCGKRRRGECGVAAVPAAREPVPLTAPDQPSIVVLPFQNISGDPEQEYFADGMVEEIITALSRIRWLFVIARNSSLTYKGKAVDVRQFATIWASAMCWKVRCARAAVGYASRRN